MLPDTQLYRGGYMRFTPPLHNMHIASVLDGNEGFCIGLAAMLQSLINVWKETTLVTNDQTGATHYVHVIDAGIGPTSRRQLSDIVYAANVTIAPANPDDTPAEHYASRLSGPLLSLSFIPLPENAPGCAPKPPSHVSGDDGRQADRRSHALIAAWAKFALAELLPEDVKHVLYLDADTLLLKDPVEIGALLDAVVDFGHLQGHESLLALGWPANGSCHYFNAWLLAAGKASGGWLEMDKKWNVQGIGSYLRDRVFPSGPLCPALFTSDEAELLERDPSLVHFTGTDIVTPTQLLNPYIPLCSKPWAAVCRSPYRVQFCAALDATPWAGWRPEYGALERAAAEELEGLADNLQAFCYPGLPISLYPLSAPQAAPFASLSADTAAQVHLCQYICASTAIPVQLCQYSCPSTSMPVQLCQYSYASTAVLVQLGQYSYARAAMPVQLCQYSYASTAMPVQLCQYHCASTAMPGQLCQYRCATTAMPVQLCQYSYASTAMLVQLCQYSYASTAMPVQLCQYSCASTAVPVQAMPVQLSSQLGQCSMQYTCQYRGLGCTACLYTMPSNSYASTAMPVQLCQYSYASTAVPANLCQYSCASTAMPVQLCQYSYASTAMPVQLCQYSYASTAVPVLLCQYSYANTAVLVQLCQYSYASTAMPVQLCQYSYASTAMPATDLGGGRFQAADFLVHVAQHLQHRADALAGAGAGVGGAATDGASITEEVPLESKEEGGMPSQEVAKAEEGHGLSDEERGRTLNSSIAGPASRPLRMMEIGCWEGRASCFLLLRLGGHAGRGGMRLGGHADSHLVCVDPFERLYPQFVKNRLAWMDNVGAALTQRRPGMATAPAVDVKATGAGVVQGSEDGPSAPVSSAPLGLQLGDSIELGGGVVLLLQLSTKHVLFDGVLAFELLAVGGVLVFDDYDWDRYLDNTACHPGEAVDALIKTHGAKLKLLHKGHQLMLQKVEE
eukprot:gene31951-33735_t